MQAFVISLFTSLFVMMNSQCAQANIEGQLRLSSFYGTDDEEAFVLFREASLNAADGDVVLNLFSQLDIETKFEQDGFEVKRLGLNGSFREVVVGRKGTDYAEGYFLVKPGTDCKINAAAQAFQCLVVGADARVTWLALTQGKRHEYSLMATDSVTHRHLNFLSTENALLVSVF